MGESRFGPVLGPVFDNVSGSGNMAISKKRKVGLVPTIAEVRKEAADRLAIETAKLALEKQERERAEVQAKTLAGDWMQADGTETLDLDTYLIESSSETTTQNRYQVSREAEVQIKLETGEQSNAVANAAYDRACVKFRGVKWYLSTIEMPSYMQRSSLIDYPMPILKLTAIHVR
jgi:hypothetical protein